MSLVVAEVLPNGRIAAACDTKISFSTADKRHLLHELHTGHPKLVLKTADELVGVAGLNIERPIADIAANRSADLWYLLRSLSRRFPDCEFLGARRGPPLLLHAENGETRNVTQLGRAWIGSGRSAYQRAAAAWGERHLSEPDGDGSFTLTAAVADVIEDPTQEDVGGVALTVIETEKGLRFQPNGTIVMAERSIGSLERHDDHFDIRMRLAPESSPTFTLQLAAGDGPTPGASGLFVAEAGFGYLWPHQSPATAIKVMAGDSARFARDCRHLHGQTILLAADPKTKGHVDDLVAMRIGSP
jgi:hypothetical protein